MSPLLLQGIASGIVTGCVYALIALSLVIVYKSSDVINFAGGEMVMLGGYLGMFAPALARAAVSADLPVRRADDLHHRRAVRPRGADARASAARCPGQSILVAMIIGTVGLSYVLKGAVRVIPYTEEVRRLPPFSSGAPIFIGPVVLQHQDIAIVDRGDRHHGGAVGVLQLHPRRQGAARHQPEPARRRAGRHSGAP